MLKGIQVYNSQNVLVKTFPVGYQGIGYKYMVRDVQGLGPVKASLVTSDFPGDGKSVQASSIEERNIVMKLGFTPDYALNDTIQDLRQALYPDMPPGSTVRLRFLDTIKPTLEITGVVESLEPTIFEQDPAVQISILATYPYFRGITELTITGKTGDYIQTNYQGSAPTGFVARIYSASDVVSIGFGNGFNAVYVDGTNTTQGDMLTIDTRRGSKRIYRTRNGGTTNWMNYLQRGGLGLTLNPMTSQVRAVLDGSSAIRDVSVVYTPQYIGL
jgi:hypothetical protein